MTTTEAKRVYLQNENDEILLPYSSQAIEDGDGNVIADTYLKTDMSNLMNPTQTAKDTIVGWGMPDFSAGVSASLPFTAPKNGICAFEGSCYSGQYFTLFVNGNKVGRTCATQQTGNASTLLFNVQKNDVITYEYSYNEISKEMTFFPLKGAN